MPSPEEPIETEAAPPKVVPPTPAPPSFGLSGSVGQDDPQQPPGAPSSPWWAPENLGGPSPAQAAQATQEEDAADDPQGAQDVHEAQAAPEAEAPEAAPVAVPEEASGAAPADRGVVTP